MSRWIFTDPVLSTTYTVPINPDSMATLSPSHQRAALAGGASESRMRVLQAYRKMNAPFDWAFSGRISSQTHYDNLLLWQQKDNPITITIHDGRVYSVILREFKPIDKRSKNPTRWTYEMTATVLERIS